MNQDADLNLGSFERAETPISALAADEVITLPEASTVRDAAKLLNEAGVGLLVIGDRQRAKAVISERDIVKAVAMGQDLDSLTATSAGSTKLRWAPAGASVGDVLEEMMNGYLRHILVRGEDGDLAGVVSMRDLLTELPISEPESGD